MIIRREKIYKKKRGIYYDTIHCISWWLLGFIPIYMNYRIINHE